MYQNNHVYSSANDYHANLIFIHIFFREADLQLGQSKLLA